MRKLSGATCKQGEIDSQGARDNGREFDEAEERHELGKKQPRGSSRKSRNRDRGKSTRIPSPDPSTDSLPARRAEYPGVRKQPGQVQAALIMALQRPSRRAHPLGFDGGPEGFPAMGMVQQPGMVGKKGGPDGDCSEGRDGRYCEITTRPMVGGCPVVRWTVGLFCARKITEL